MSINIQQQIFVDTSGHGDMHDLTDQVKNIVSASGVQMGTVTVSAVGSAAVGTIEFQAGAGLQRNLPEILYKTPPTLGQGHEEDWHRGNGHSHLQATLPGPSLSVPIVDGKPILGTWQQIFHLECGGGARQRSVVITVGGE